MDYVTISEIVADIITKALLREAFFKFRALPVVSKATINFNSLVLSVVKTQVEFHFCIQFKDYGSKFEGLRRQGL